MKTVAFGENTICERGTTCSVFDYAYYNEKILGNKSIIIYDKNSPGQKKEMIEYIETMFPVVVSDSYKDIDDIVEKYEVTHFYKIKYGFNDHVLSKIAKNCVHCVFSCHDPHGDVYASVSPWVKNNNGKYPCVPHMINLPQHDRNLREKLGIPPDATVFGGYGGRDRFSIGYARQAVYNVARNFSNIYFLFANFDQFCPKLPNIIHMDTIYDKENKVEFINTCDAMMWARADGETFGLAIAEFSTKNKPVFATKTGVDDAHVELLGNKAIWYNPQNLETLLISFDKIKDKIKNNDWNAYRDYEPEKVIKIFDEVFLNDDETNKVVFNNLEIEYFKNDLLAIGSIQKQIEWEPHITKFMELCNHNFKLSNVIDVGANFGYHSLIFSKNINGNVYAFEPQPQNYKLLKNNIENNKIKNIIHYNLACGNDNLKVKMPIVNTSKKINMGDFTPNFTNEHYELIDTKTLDEMDFPKIDLIKIDVQGWEKNVINGSKELLNKYKPILIVEFEQHQLIKTNTSCEELFKLIRNNNYYIFYLEYKYPSDHVCIHNDNLEHFRKTMKDYIKPNTTNNNINNNLGHGVTEKISTVLN